MPGTPLPHEPIASFNSDMLQFLVLQGFLGDRTVEAE